MSELTGGPFYHMIGKTGNNVGRWLRGKNVFSMAPHKSGKPGTAKQQAWTNIMGAMFSLLSYIPDLIDVGFNAYDAHMSTMNAAVSYNAKNAISGLSPNYHIDYSKLSFSRGRLKGPNTGTVTAALGAKMVFNWLETEDGVVSNGSDMVTLMAYHITRGEFVSLQGAGLRSDLTCTLQAPADFSGYDMHCYLSFVSVDGRVSNSAYFGILPLL